MEQEDKCSARKCKKWTVEEDKMLVQCLVELYHKGTHNADCGFRNGYQHVVEIMLALKLPHSGFEARQIDNRLRALKKEWSIVNDMLYGNHTSGFVWDETRKLVIAEQSVWDEFVKSHKNAAKYRNKRLPYFEDLSMIFGTIGNDAETAAKDFEDSFQSMTPTASNGSTRWLEGSKKRKGYSNETAHLVRIAKDLTSKLAEAMKQFLNTTDENKELTIHLLHATKELANGLMANQLTSEKSMKVWGELRKIDWLSVAEKVAASVKILANPNTLLAFFTIPAELKDKWVKVLLAE